MWIRPKDYESMTSGSVESMIAETEWGKDVTVLSTFLGRDSGDQDLSTCRVVFEKDGEVFESKIVGGEVGEPQRMNVSLYESPQLAPVDVSQTLLSAARKIMGGDVKGGVEEAILVKSDVQRDTPYFFWECVEKIEGAIDCTPDWLEYYEEHKKSVRKSLHGKLGSLESKFESKKFGAMSLKRLLENVDVLEIALESAKREMLTCQDALNIVECDFDGRNLLRDSLSKDCREVGNLIGHMLEVVDGAKGLPDEKLKALAVLFDLISNRGKDMVVMARHLVGEPQEEENEQHTPLDL